MAGDSKTEKATPKKRRDERKKGNVFQSKDIITVISIMAIFLTIKFTFSFSYSYMSNLFIKYVGYMKTTTEFSQSFILNILVDGVIAMIVVVGPVMLVAMFVGVVASGVQTKFIMAKDSIKPKFNRMSLLQGAKRLFSLKSIVELLKSLIKIILIIVVLYMGYTKIVHNFPKLMAMGIVEATAYVFDQIINVVFQIVLVFGIIAFFDYLYQWWDYEKNMRMSKQDLKEEYKHMEGDPQVKGKIKEKQRKVSMQRMMQAVPTADVVVRNPTHFAVALKYDIEKDMAPIVVAKGQDLNALRIVKIAEEHNIPTTENKPLARALYDTVEPNMPIPQEFYAVLAEVMAWVYSLKQKDK